MKRRDLLRKTALGGLFVTGVSSAAAGSSEDRSSEVIRLREDGQWRVVSKPDAGDAGTQSHCHENCCEDCDLLACNVCYCQGWCDPVTIV